MNTGWDLLDFLLVGGFVAMFVFFVRVARGSGRERSIMVACQLGDEEEVRSLLRGARWLANGVDSNGMTPLHLAALSGFPGIVWLLLKYKANVNARAHNGMTPLHAAAMAGHTDVAELLLVRGALVNARDELGNTALYVASWDGQIEMVRLLLAHGAELDCHTDRGDHPVARARQRQHHDAVALMTDLSAAPTAKPETAEAAAPGSETPTSS